MISALVHSSGVLETAPEAPFFFFGDFDLLPFVPFPGDPERALPRSLVDMNGIGQVELIDGGKGGNCQNVVHKEYLCVP